MSNAGWAVCVAFVIWLTAYGRGSLVEYLLGSHVWEPLARLTFGAYLVHPLIIVAEQVPVILCALVPCVCPVCALWVPCVPVCCVCVPGAPSTLTTDDTRRGSTTDGGGVAAAHLLAHVVAVSRRGCAGGLLRHRAAHVPARGGAPPSLSAPMRVPPPLPRSTLHSLPGDALGQRASPHCPAGVPRPGPTVLEHHPLPPRSSTL